MIGSDADTTGNSPVVPISWKIEKALISEADIVPYFPKHNTGMAYYVFLGKFWKCFNEDCSYFNSEIKITTDVS